MDSLENLTENSMEDRVFELMDYGLYNRIAYKLNQKGIMLSDLVKLDFDLISSNFDFNTKQLNNIQNAISKYLNSPVGFNRWELNNDLSLETEYISVDVSELLKYGLKVKSYVLIKNCNKEIKTDNLYDLNNIEGLGKKKITKVKSVIDRYKKDNNIFKNKEIIFNNNNDINIDILLEYGYTVGKLDSYLEMGLDFFTMLDSSKVDLLYFLSESEANKLYNNLLLIEENNDFLHSGWKYLLKNINRHIDSLEFTITKLKTILSNTNYDINYLLDDLNELRNRGRITYTEEYIKINHIMIKEYLESSILKNEDRLYLVFVKRLKGDTLGKIAKNTGLSRERIRQLEVKALKYIDNVFEDKYINLFEEYSFSPKTAKVLFGIDNFQYNYIMLRCNEKLSNKKSELDFLNDFNKNISHERIKQIYDEHNYVLIDDLVIRKKKTDLLRYYLKYKASKDKIHIDKLFDECEEFIKSYIDNGYESVRNFEPAALRQNMMLACNNKYFKILDVKSKALELKDKLDETLAEVDNNYSTLYFFNKDKDFYISRNIESEYELHSLLKQYCSIFNIETDVTFDKMPVIYVKNKKDEFIRQQIMLLAPISLDEFIDAMYDEYGHDKDSMRAKFTMFYSEYIVNEKIVNESQIRELSNEEIDLARSLMNRDVYRYNDLLDILRDNGLEGLSHSISNSWLKSIGYIVKRGYILKDRYGSVSEYIEDYLLSDGIIDITSLRNTVNINLVYTKINELKNSFSILNVGSDEYISLINAQDSINLDKFKKDIYTIVDLLEEDKFYSISTLLDDSSIYNVYINSELYKLGFEDSVLLEAICMLDNISRITFRNNDLLIKSNIVISKWDFFESLLEENYLYLHKLKDILNNYYKLEVDNSEIKKALCNIPEQRDLYYNSTLEKLYKHREIYIMEVWG